jgi:hypothetical protein
MALLAYLVMVACLMTSVFIGYEWVATSSPRLTMSRTEHELAHTRSARAASKALLAATSAPSTSSAARDDSHLSPNQGIVPSDDEVAHEHGRLAHARHHRLRTLAQRPNGPVLGRTVVGYTAEPAAFGRDRTD